MANQTLKLSGNMRDIDLTEIDQCQCADPQCPYCAGRCTRDYELTIYRIDMEDHTGTRMCEQCSEDAMQSGVFRYAGVGEEK